MAELENVSILEIDMVNSNSCKTLIVKQGDINSRKFIITLTVNGVQYEIPEGTTANYAIEKPYMTAIWNPCDSIEANRVLGTFTSESMSTHGIFPMHIELWKDGIKYSSLNFNLRVEKSARIADEQVGKNEYGVLDNLIYNANQYAERIENAEKEVVNAIKDCTEAINRINELHTLVTDAEGERVDSENDRTENESERIAQAEQMKVDFDKAIERINIATERAEAIANNFIDDTTISLSTTWSSNKISSLFEFVTDEQINMIFT